MVKSATSRETVGELAEEVDEDAGAHRRALRGTRHATHAARRGTSPGNAKRQLKQSNTDAAEDAVEDDTAGTVAEEAILSPPTIASRLLTLSRHTRRGPSDPPVVASNKSLLRRNIITSRETGNGGQGERPPPHND